MVVIFLIGRVILGLFFIYSAYNHFSKIASTAGYAASKGVVAPQAAVILTGVLLLVGGVSVLLGLYPVVGLTCLVAFFIPVTFLMHSFWTDTDPNVRMMNMVNFTKNLALLGALLMMYIIPKPWPMSLVK